MMKHLAESDWKKCRALQAIALQRYCERVLLEVQSKLSDTTKSAHERYREVYSLIEERDEVLARLFDDFRRSTAALQIIGMIAEKLLTEDELNCFSDDFKSQLF